MGPTNIEGTVGMSLEGGGAEGTPLSPPPSSPPGLVSKASCRPCKHFFLLQDLQNSDLSWTLGFILFSFLNPQKRKLITQKRLKGFSKIHSWLEEESRLSPRPQQHPDITGRILPDWCAFAGGIGKLHGVIVASGGMKTYPIFKSIVFWVFKVATEHLDFASHPGPNWKYNYTGEQSPRIANQRLGD